MPSIRTELQALRNMIAEVEAILSTTKLPQGRTARSLELLRAALKLNDDLLKESRMNAAAVLGKKGGASIAKRGPEYFRELAAKRKTKAGGRPRKVAIESAKDKSSELTSMFVKTLNANVLTSEKKHSKK